MRPATSAPAATGDARGERGGRRILGLRATALLETVLFLAAALAVDTFLGNADRFAGVSPHPFWIVVLLVSAYYGTNEGLVAAALSSMALLAFNLPEQGFNEELYSWLLRATTEPLLWFVAAVVLGEMRTSQRRERDALREELGETREQARAITDAYTQLSRLKDGLEARVAGQVRTVYSMYVASRAIERQDTGQVLAGIRQLVRTVLSPRKFSLFLLEGQALEAILSEGWSEDDGYGAVFDQSSPLYQAVITHQQFLTVTNPTHGLVLGAEGLLAGPLVSAETGEIIGMLKIEGMDFLELNPGSVQNFRVLCEWIGSAFANAQRFEESQANQYFDPVRRLLPQPLFQLQRLLMTSLAERLGFDLSVMFLGLEQPEEAGPSAGLAAARVASRLAERLLAPTDLRFDYREGGWHIAVLLPGADRARAEELARGFTLDLVEELTAAGLSADARFMIETLHQCQAPLLLVPRAAH
jgi:polysaccharide biosynthesis protein PelD